MKCYRRLFSIIKTKPAHHIHHIQIIKEAPPIPSLRINSHGGTVLVTYTILLTLLYNQERFLTQLDISRLHTQEWDRRQCITWHTVVNNICHHFTQQLLLDLQSKQHLLTKAPMVPTYSFSTFQITSQT